jgi:crossover junction endodeoxyribonuclease RuvC
MSNNLYIGIDPSLTGTGIVYLKDDEIVYQELISSKPRGKDVINELERILDIIKRVDIDEDVCPKLIAMEGLAFMARNTSALVQLGYLNYRLRENFYNNKHKFIIVAPTSLKKFACEKGNAKKEMVLLETYKRWGMSFNDDNLCDAYVLARIAQAYSEEINITKTQQEVITKLNEN